IETNVSAVQSGFTESQSVITRLADGRRGGRAQHGRIGPDGTASDVNGAPSGLRRNVGLTSLMFISLGSIIGSGWLLGALTAAKAAGGAAPVSWPLGRVENQGE